MDSRILGLVLLVIGAGLLFWGFQARESISSGFSEAFQGAPSNKAIWLFVAGGLVAAFGLLKLLRRRPS